MNEQPMTCAGLEERLPLFVGDDLESGARSAVEAHLAGCVACRERERAARAAREAFRAAVAAESEPSPPLWPGVRAGLVREGLVEGPRAVRGPRVLLRRVAAVAAVVLLAGLGWRALDGDDPEVRDVRSDDGRAEVVVDFPGPPVPAGELAGEFAGEPAEDRVGADGLAAGDPASERPNGLERIDGAERLMEGRERPSVHALASDHHR